MDSCSLAKDLCDPLFHRSLIWHVLGGPQNPFCMPTRAWMPWMGGVKAPPWCEWFFDVEVVTNSHSGCTNVTVQAAKSTPKWALILAELWSVHLPHPRKYSISYSSCMATDRWQCNTHFSDWSTSPIAIKMRMRTMNHLKSAWGQSKHPTGWHNKSFPCSKFILWWPFQFHAWVFSVESRTKFGVLLHNHQSWGTLLCATSTKRCRIAHNSAKMGMTEQNPCGATWEQRIKLCSLRLVCTFVVTTRGSVTVLHLPSFLLLFIQAIWAAGQNCTSDIGFGISSSDAVVCAVIFLPKEGAIPIAKLGRKRRKNSACVTQ